MYETAHQPTLTPYSNSNGDGDEEWHIYSNTQSIMCQMKWHIFKHMTSFTWREMNFGWISSEAY